MESWFQKPRHSIDWVFLSVEFCFIFYFQGYNR